MAKTQPGHEAQEKERLSGIGEMLKNKILKARKTAAPYKEYFCNECDADGIKYHIDSVSNVGRYKVCNCDKFKHGQYYCPKCGGHGFYTVTNSEGNSYAHKCECGISDMLLNLTRLKSSGLSEQIKEKRFDNYNAAEDWQKDIKQAAEKFAAGNYPMFYIGGQTGAGKSHICTAIVGVLCKKMGVRYVSWGEFYNELFGLKFHPSDDDGVNYIHAVNKYKTAAVLYIDDLFKQKDGDASRVNKSEVDIAFEIINYRYNNSKLKTIISSEFNPRELIHIDEAVGGRIIEKAAEFCLVIGKSRDRNQRLKRLK